MSPLTTLPPDLLMAVLVITPASTHEALRNTCRTIRNVIDSQDFAIERSKTGHSQVSVTLTTPFQQGPPLVLPDFLQQYADELGLPPLVHDFPRPQIAQILSATIHVDGKVGGSATVVLIPREMGRNFYREAEAMQNEVRERDLTVVSRNFFDREGQPRLKCLRSYQDEASVGGFVYISTFHLDPVYWHSSHEASVAIRKLLCDTELHEKWTVAVYIADARAHFTDEDCAEEQRRRNLQFREMRSDDETEKEDDSDQEWTSRFDGLAKKDLRPFLRAGFRQAEELLAVREGYYLFAVPSFFVHQQQRPMSDEETMALSIVEKPHFADSPTGVNERLLRVVARACARRQNIHGHEEGKLPSVDETRGEIVQLLQDGATIEKSHALHCCAFNLDTELIGLVLEYAESGEEAINALDSRGLTPLMCASASDLTRYSAERQRRVSETCSKLIELGADKNMVSHTGKSAVGYMFETISPRDFGRIFGDEALLSGFEDLTGILEPSAGLTEDDKFVYGEISRDWHSRMMLGTTGSDSDDDFDY